MSVSSVASLLTTLSQATLYDLEQPRYAGAPIFAAHRPGFVYTLHRRHETGLGEPRTSASGLIITAEHSGTHIDALCHQAVDMQMFGGRRVGAGTQTSSGFTQLGVETIPPMIARGVLIDIPRHRGVDRLPAGAVIGADELEAAASEQQVSVTADDVVLIRTGTGSLWNEPDEYLQGAGISGEASEWLADYRVQAVGADNVAWDALQPDLQRGSLPGHAVLIVHNGIYIIENMQLEELAASGHQEFVFMCLPLKMVGVTGSPVRPLAVVPA